MKVKLVFHDWIDKDQKSVYSTEKGVELTTGPFHHGTVFYADIDLVLEDQMDLYEAIKQGYTPVFYVVREKKDE